jgi:subtilisin family serine protease
VAPKATVIPVAYEPVVSAYTAAIVYAANLKVSGTLGMAPLVINLSNGDPVIKPFVRAAFDYAIDAGAIVVAAAGNEADGGMVWPGAYPEVISVAATGRVSQFPADDPTRYRWILRDLPENDVAQHFIAPFSSRELPGQELDVAAPGMMVPVPSTLQGQQPDYTFGGGTSFAAPHVSGLAALMLQKNPLLTQAQVESLLEASSLPLPDGCSTVRWPSVPDKAKPTWEDLSMVSLADLTTCWDARTTGHGLVQADAALAAVPAP